MQSIKGSEQGRKGQKKKLGVGGASGEKPHSTLEIYSLCSDGKLQILSLAIDKPQVGSVGRRYVTEAAYTW